MPFTSKKQMKYMFATDPKVAEKMAKRQEKKSGKGVFKKLPKTSKKSQDNWGDSIQTMEPIR